MRQSAQAQVWQNPRVVLTLTVVFLCGVSAGMLAMAMGAHRMMHSQSTPAWKDGGKEVTLQRFRKELNLSQSQTEQLESVLDDYFTYYHTLQAQLDDVRSSGKERVLRILNDDQKKKFEQIMSELQDKTLH